jgi:hypothetical protein
MWSDDFDEHADLDTTFEVIGLIALCLLVVFLFSMLFGE